MSFLGWIFLFAVYSIAHPSCNVIPFFFKGKENDVKYEMLCTSKKGLVSNGIFTFNEGIQYVEDKGKNCDIWKISYDYTNNRVSILADGNVESECGVIIMNDPNTKQNKNNLFKEFPTTLNDDNGCFCAFNVTSKTLRLEAISTNSEQKDSWKLKEKNENYCECDFESPHDIIKVEKQDCDASWDVQTKDNMMSCSTNSNSKCILDMSW